MFGKIWLSEVMRHGARNPWKADETDELKNAEG